MVNLEETKVKLRLLQSIFNILLVTIFTLVGWLAINSYFHKIEELK